MSKKTNNLLLLGFIIGFFIVGYLTFMDALPQDKNKRVYAELQPYLPYTIEKRLGGFTIVDKKTGEKEKPPASEALKYMDSLDKTWGKECLKIEGNVLIILDENKSTIRQLEITPQEKQWIQTFFEI